MGRATFLSAVAVAGALAAAGCGASTTAAPRAAVPATPRAAVESTDGRLGDATAVRPGTPPDELSPGGRPDLRERRDGPRRDGVGAGAPCPNPDLAPSADGLAAIAEATLCLLNGERADRGLAPLAPEPRLTAAATAYAQDLVDGSYFSHTGSDDSSVLDRIRRTGYVPRNRAWALGENLAWGTGALAAPAAIVLAWMNSPGHRENILNPSYREIGVGVVAGNPAQTNGAGATYANEFGVVEDEAAEPARPKAKSARKRKHTRRGVQARAGRRARTGKARGPIARSAV